MSWTNVIITKYLINKFSYVLYDLGIFYENMADEELVSRLTTGKRKEPSRSDRSHSEEDSPQKQRRQNSREDACPSPVTLGLFHEFL